MIVVDRKGKSKSELIRGLHNIRERHRGNVVTLGSFDGIHLGHQHVINHLIDKSNEYGIPSVVVIFEPQPLEFLAPERAPARLMRFREKVDVLFDTGVDRVFCLHFDQYLSGLSAEDFCRKVLIDGLGTKYLVVGDDFRFGHDRKGDFEFLCRQGELFDFGVSDTKTHQYSSERVSSTRIRGCLAKGDVEEAEKLLGRPYFMSGRVVYGNQIGRKLGVPTANVGLRRHRTPLSGVFAVKVKLPNSAECFGVANVGVRPSVDGIAKPILEVHLFDFSGNLYGHRINVEFCQKIRDEMKFESLDILKKNIESDIACAKRIFNLS